MKCEHSIALGIVRTVLADYQFASLVGETLASIAMLDSNESATHQLVVDRVKSLHKEFTHSPALLCIHFNFSGATLRWARACFRGKRESVEITVRPRVDCLGWF